MSKVDWPKKRFTVKPEHLKLLGEAWVSWEDCEYGAPAIDCKRPYGNSSVAHDIHEILGGKKLGDEEELTEEQLERYAALHKETQTALQIVLATQSFVPGLYEADEYHRNWRLAQRTGA